MPKEKSRPAGAPGKMARKGYTAMSFFRRPDYQSEATQFIQKLKTDKPQLEQQQWAGRALLWDKNVDRSLQGEYRLGRLRQKPYVYQTDTDADK